MLHPRISIDSLCFMGEELGKIAGHWHDLGARCVSFVGQELERWGVPAAKSVVNAGGYTVATIPHNFSHAPLSADENDWALPQQRLNAMIDMAEAIGARSIYMLTGARGDMTWEAAADVFANAIIPCRDHARRAGVALLIENAPAYNADLHIAHTLRDTLTLAEMSGIGVNIDIFGCWWEAGLDELIGRALPRCGVVQVSDYVLGDRTSPCRAVSGDGAIPLRTIIKRLLDGGYQGAFDLELIGPRIDAEGRLAATRRSAAWLDTVLRELGA